MKTIQSGKQSGGALVVVLTVLATLMVIVAVAAEYTSTINRHVQRSNTEQTAVNVADNSLEIMFSHWRAICSAPGNPTTPQTTSQFASISLPTATQLNLPSSANLVQRGTSHDPDATEHDPAYTISNYKVVAVNAQWKALSDPAATPQPMLGQIAGVVSSSNLPTTSLVYNYIASADVTLPTIGPAGSRTLVARVRRVFQKQQLSPWNFAIFYVDPLEIHPGPQFTVTGWVHTNSDLYTGHNTLTFADKVTYGADWFVDFMPGETTHNGETPAPPNYLANLPPARDQAMQPFGLDSQSIFSTTNPNPNDDSYHELIEQVAPGYTDPLAGQRYYDQAAIKILIPQSGPPTIRKFDGTAVTSSSTGNDLKLYTAVNAALNVTAQRSIQDNREGASIRLTTLDVASLVTSLNNLPTNPNYIESSRWNGIIYITDTSYNPSSPASTRRGVRIKNAKILPSSGLTIASANPVYIQGDYNTGFAPPSNSGTPTDPEGTTTPTGSTSYTRKPASVIADAVNILSNSWDDAKHDWSLSARVATPTTVNAAILAGIMPSSPVGGDGTYSGGAENFPRFLETWGADTTLTYYGSMVQLWQSQQSKGKWGSANVYVPPDRKWYFDPNFKTKPPPGSLMLYSYIKGKWTLL